MSVRHLITLALNSDFYPKGPPKPKRAKECFAPHTKTIKTMKEYKKDARRPEMSPAV